MPTPVITHEMQGDHDDSARWNFTRALWGNTHAIRGRWSNRMTPRALPIERSINERSEELRDEECGE